MKSRVCLSCAALFWLAQAVPEQPNIVFILADDLGWADVGFNEASDVFTPNIDRLALDEGIVLSQYYTYPLGAPAKSAFLTGRYGEHTGVMGSIPGPKPYGLPLNETLISEVLQLNDAYATFAIGQWQMGFPEWDYTPTSRGFDRFFGSLLGAQSQFDHVKCESDSTVELCGRDLRDGVDAVEMDGFLDYLFADAFDNFTKEHMESANGEEQPFFVFYAPQAAHSPNEAPKNISDLYESEDYETSTSGIPLQISDSLRLAHDSLITALDTVVLGLEAQLKTLEYNDTTPVWENTLLVFASDNGPSKALGGYSWPLRGAKGSYFEGAVRVPAFVSGGYLHEDVRGTELNGLVHITDWLPTFAEAAGVSVDDLQLDGYSLWPQLEDSNATYRNETTERDEVLHYVTKDARVCDTQYNGDTLCGALRKGAWKVVFGGLITGVHNSVSDRNYSDWHSLPDLDIILNHTSPVVDCGGEGVFDDSDCPFNGEPCLFNIENDPCEIWDVKDENPEKLDELMTRLLEFRDETVEPLNAKYLDDFDLCSDPQLNGGFWTPAWKCVDFDTSTSAPRPQVNVDLENWEVELFITLSAVLLSIVIGAVAYFTEDKLPFDVDMSSVLSVIFCCKCTRQGEDGRTQMEKLCSESRH